MAYFDFKLKSLYIKNNREINKAELQIFSFIAADSSINTEMFSGFLSADEPTKKNILKAATQELLSTRQIFPIQNIPDNYRMNFGNNGLSLYRSNKIPEFFDWNFAVFESDEDIRKFGSKLNNLIDHASYNGFLENLITAAAITATPQVYAIAKLTQFIGKVVAGELMANQDDQICVYCESFNKYENYPQLNLKGVDVEDMTGNCRLTYSLFGKE